MMMSGDEEEGDVGGRFVLIVGKLMGKWRSWGKNIYRTTCLHAWKRGEYIREFDLVEMEFLTFGFGFNG